MQDHGSVFELTDSDVYLNFKAKRIEAENETDFLKIKVKYKSLFQEFTSRFIKVESLVAQQAFNDFILSIIYHKTLLETFKTKDLIKELIPQLKCEINSTFFRPIYQDFLLNDLRYVILGLMEDDLDVSHQSILRFIFSESNLKTKVYNDVLNELSFYNREVKPPPLKIARSLRIMRDLKESSVPDFARRILRLQASDLVSNLKRTFNSRSNVAEFHRNDWNKVFTVESPLRLGLSSANASDNHIRSKEQGARAVNAAIYIDQEGIPVAPIQLSIRRINEPSFRIISRDLHTSFEMLENDAKNLENFFRYRREPDELCLLKQAFVHTGIIQDDGADPLSHVEKFAGGGGLELTSNVRVPKGTGLGTSSILAATILLLLYRISSQYAGMDLKQLFDDSLFLEQSLGFNSGWQDARGAIGGPSSIKEFKVQPTTGLPNPAVEFLSEVNEKALKERLIIFDTGIQRFATENLNVLLDAYLARDEKKYPAMKESFVIHSRIVNSLKRKDYEALGREFNQYFKYRVSMDSGATTPEIEKLFNSLQTEELIEGGLLTGAGGGGFALLVSKEGKSQNLISYLRDFPLKRSRVVPYHFVRTGLKLTETES